MNKKISSTVTNYPRENLLLSETNTLFQEKHFSGKGLRATLHFPDIYSGRNRKAFIIFQELAVMFKG
jgi:hypothetical protein